MPRRLDTTYNYVRCADGKERVFYPYKKQNYDTGLVRGYIRVFEPSLSLPSTVVPGWVTLEDLTIFNVNPNTERAHVLDEVMRRQNRLTDILTSDPIAEWKKIHNGDKANSAHIPEDTD